MSIKEVNVVSWNILIEGWKTGAKPCLKDVSWETRRESIVQRVVRMDPHVICFQEVDRFDSLAERMAQIGYYGVLANRNNGQNEGCALFYKHKEICILNINNQGQEVFFFNDGTGRMIQKVVVKMLSEGNNAPITFLNTHIVNAHSFQNNVDEGFSKRTEELRQLANHAAKASEGGNPVIVCGDFNVSSEQGDRTYLQGFRDNGFVDSFDNSVNRNKPTVLFSGTHKTENSAIAYRRIDFAFSKNIQCLRSDVRGNPANLENTNEPSDHLAILSHYAIPKQHEVSSLQVERLVSQLNNGDINAAAKTLENLPNEKKMEICQLFAKALNNLK